MSPPLQDPQKLSVESLIFYANQTLDHALRGYARGMPQYLFKNCAAVCIVRAIEVGFVYNGSVGSGILIAKKDDGTWGNPVACALVVEGIGASLGGASKDLVAFLPEKAINSFVSGGFKLGLKGQLTLIKGREGGWGFGGDKSAKLNQVTTIAFTKGAFVSLALEYNMVGPRPKINDRFYEGCEIPTADIIEGKIPFPADKVTLLAEVHQKLDRLSGKTTEEGDTDSAKIEAAKAAALKADEDIRKGVDHIVELQQADLSSLATEEAA